MNQRAKVRRVRQQNAQQIGRASEQFGGTCERILGDAGSLGIRQSEQALGHIRFLPVDCFAAGYPLYASAASAVTQGCLTPHATPRPGHLPALDQIVHRFGFLQRAQFGHQRPNFTTRNKIAGFKDFRRVT